MSRVSVAGLIAAALAFATDGVYLALLRSEDESDTRRATVRFVAALIAAAAAGCAAGAVSRQPRRRRALLGAAGAVLICLGVVGIFSIGAPLLVAGALAFLAAIRTDAPAADAP